MTLVFSLHHIFWACYPAADQTSVLVFRRHTSVHHCIRRTWVKSLVQTFILTIRTYLYFGSNSPSLPASIGNVPLSPKVAWGPFFYLLLMSCHGAIRVWSLKCLSFSVASKLLSLIAAQVVYSYLIKLHFSWFIIGGWIYLIGIWIRRLQKAYFFFIRHTSCCTRQFEAFS